MSVSIIFHVNPIIVLELKKLGIELDMPPNKLKTGHGDGVCAVIYKLAAISLQNKFKFKKPVLKGEGGNLEDEGDDMGEGDMDGGADIADLANQEIDEDDIEDFVDFGGQKQVE